MWDFRRDTGILKWHSGGYESENLQDGIIR
jgi:hypothetical protein